MRRLFFTAFFFCTMLLPVFSHAQSEKETSAIANFQLAEEAYDNKDYNKALDYLEEAKKGVGAKPKLLFLQIMIEQEMLIDGSSMQKLLKLINDFEKAKGIETFSNDKKMLVAKNKVLLKERLAQQMALEEKEKQEKIALEKKQKAGSENFEKFTIKDLPFGLSVEEFRRRYPEILPANCKKEISFIEGINLEIYYSKSIFFERDDKGFNFPYSASTGNPIYDTTIYAVLVKEGKVIGFNQTLYYYNSKGKGNLSWSDAIAKKFAVSAQMLESFAFAPETNNVNYWTWRKVGASVKTIGLLADEMQTPNGNKWKSSLTIRVINFSLYN